MLYCVSVGSLIYTVLVSVLDKHVSVKQMLNKMTVSYLYMCLKCTGLFFKPHAVFGLGRGVCGVGC